MKITIPLAGILALAVVAPAQQDPRPPVQDARARLQALEQEVDAAVTAWREESRRIAEEAQKAREEGRSPAIRAMRMRPDFTPLIPKFEAAAGDFAGTDDAVPFLVWIVRNGGGADSAEARSAIATLTDDHAGSGAIHELVTEFEYLPRMVGTDAAGAFAAAVRETNRDPNILGWLTLGELGPKIDDLASDSEAYAAAKKQLLAHAEKATDAGLKQQIQAKIDLKEKFGVGATAADIEGIDLDGDAFKLSDYEGKVVFLDFWGDW